MSPGRAFERIDEEPQEIDFSGLVRAGAEVVQNNARKHGLIAELALKSALEWYHIILNDPAINLPDADVLSEKKWLALNLAQAEVRFQSVLHSIDKFEQ